MILLRKIVPCLAIALLAAPPVLAAAAAPLRLPRHFVLSRAHVANAPRGNHRFAASPGDVGSANTVTADAPVPRPNETPCVKTLFANATFSQYAAQTFAYTPPAGCPGPFAKIVFNGTFGVSAGVQFDRTASIEVGNVPIYFGTTAEPGSNLSPTWHVERDITDEAALLAKPQSVEADIFNIVDSTYTGVISGTAFVQFYPATKTFPAATTPDVVLPFPGVAGGPQILNTGSSALVATYTLPMNTDGAYIDVYAQSQQEDEQYFNCAPTDVAAELFACPDGPLRETEIAIDGQPAGVAPVSPWIFTGGLDPYLWFPIPGVQTLEFKPYRVNLTPFAAKLANGKPHTISLSVDNADAYFQAFGTLLAFTDHGSKTVTGALTQDTLVANPPASTQEHLSGTSPSIDGTIEVSSTRGYRIAGYVKTSKGLVATTVDESLAFDNKQTYSNESDTTGTLAVQQTTTALQTVTTIGDGGIDVASDLFAFPLTESLALVLDDTGTGTQVASIDQHYSHVHVETSPFLAFASYESNEVKPTDTLEILDDEFITGNANQSSTQTFSSFDTTGNCYTQSIKAANNVVTAVSPPACVPSMASRTLRALLRR